MVKTITLKISESDKNLLIYGSKINSLSLSAYIRLICVNHSRSILKKMEGGALSSTDSNDPRN